MHLVDVDVVAVEEGTKLTTDLVQASGEQLVQLLKHVGQLALMVDGNEVNLVRLHIGPKVVMTVVDTRREMHRPASIPT